MLKKINQLLIFFLISLLLYFIITGLFSIGSREASFVLILYSAALSALFNSLLVLFMRIVGLINLFDMSLKKQVIEIMSYILLVLAFDYAARKSPIDSLYNYLEFPLPFIYPCILIIIFFVVRKFF